MTLDRVTGFLAHKDDWCGFFLFLFLFILPRKRDGWGVGKKKERKNENEFKGWASDDPFLPFTLSFDLSYMHERNGSPSQNGKKDRPLD